MCSSDLTARVMDATTGRELARLAHQGPVYAVAFSPDGKRVAIGSADNTARVMDATTGKELARLAHQNTVDAVAFSPDGRQVATGSWDNTARVMNATSGQELARLTHLDTVRVVAFSGDGKWVATATADRTSRVMSAATGEERMRIVISAAGVRFSRDGRFLEILERDRFDNDLLYRHFPLDPRDLIREACATVTRNLTLAEWRQYVGKEILYQRSCDNLPYPVEDLAVGSPVVQ